MKIIFLHRVWPAYGGGETVTVCLANEMIKRGFKVHVAYLKDSPEGKSRPYIDNHLICHRIENVRFDEFGSDFFVDKKEAAYVSSELVKIIGLKGIDIIHNQWWPAEFLEGVHEHTQAKVVKVLHMDVDIRIFPDGKADVLSCFIRCIVKWKDTRISAEQTSIIKAVISSYSLLRVSWRTINASPV